MPGVTVLACHQKGGIVGAVVVERGSHISYLTANPNSGSDGIPGRAVVETLLSKCITADTITLEDAASDKDFWPNLGFSDAKHGVKSEYN